ncbi:membrane protein [Mycolicibacterium murale]|jgi:hypothetical protein|uniref:Protein of uncharacterized function (DUF3060) n=2 Tax=Mycolicibacterium TaxID=1866885 RepID=A0A378TBU8_9MYCO|nr:MULTISPECIES: DUF3060 domain-containing protein [Mycolicibacterium]ANW63474.1 hypothetical protein BCA37_07575 [Mycobacterium sp. djl-10]MCV7185792.1 DUF3060 domain-containing protein [Mycolicibacterium murale]GFG61339.1 membrane protein [Mycolicibacterium murale]STZ58090.1 Protein of uncharacterised function (DUF3060) [Mycolicibacterium tokaiense]
MVRKSAVSALAGCAVLTAGLLAGAPAAVAKNGDTHITGVGVTRTVDCNDSVLFVNGSNNTITALGNCWAVTMQGSYNTVVADNVINDITVYGFEQTAFFKNGAPALIDRGRELGMTNRIARVPA